MTIAESEHEVTGPRPAGRASTPRLIRWLPVLVPMAVMTGLGIWGIDRGSMYGTEAASYWAAHLPLPQLHHLLSRVDAVHGLYYLLMHGLFFFGSGEVLLRLPATVGMIAAVGLTARIAQRLTGSTRVTIFAGLAMASVPVINDYAQVGRSYGIDTALVMASSLALLRALEVVPGRLRLRWVTYAALVALSGYLHEMTALMIVCHGVTLAVCRMGWAQFRRWAISAASALVVMIPIIAISHAQDKALSWIHGVTWSTSWELLRALLGPSRLVVALMVALVIVGLTPARLWSPARPDAVGEPGAAVISLPAFALPLFVLPGAVLLIESVVAVPLYGGVRYVLYSVSGAALLVGLAVDRVVGLVARHVRGGVVQLALGVIVVTALFLVQLSTQVHQRTASGQPQDLHAAAKFIERSARDGDAILYIPAAYSFARLVYPGDFAHVADIAQAQSPATSGHFYGVAKHPHDIKIAMLGERRIWEFGIVPAGRDTPRLKFEREVLAMYFHPSTTASFAGVKVALYLRNQAATRA